MTRFHLEREEVFLRYNQLINIRFPAIIIFLGAAFFLEIFLSIPFPPLLFFLVSVMALSTVIFDFLVLRIVAPTINQIVQGYFFFMLFDLIILTAIIYIIGGVTWIGFVFYSLYIYIGFLIFPRRYALFYTFYCSLLYTSMVFIQYKEIFPAQGIFPLEARDFRNLAYTVSSWLAAVLFLWVLGVYGDTFYQLLQGKIEELQKARRTLEEERTSLEIRVQARTKELFEERSNLEEKVRLRTKELEERVRELERFHKVAVGRELKMRELKQEIERLKEEENKKAKG